MPFRMFRQDMKTSLNTKPQPEWLSVHILSCQRQTPDVVKQEIIVCLQEKSSRWGKKQQARNPQHQRSNQHPFTSDCCGVWPVPAHVSLPCVCLSLHPALHPSLHPLHLCLSIPQSVSFPVLDEQSLSTSTLFCFGVFLCVCVLFYLQSQSPVGSSPLPWSEAIQAFGNNVSHQLRVAVDVEPCSYTRTGTLRNTFTSNKNTFESAFNFNTHNQRLCLFKLWFNPMWTCRINAAKDQCHSWGNEWDLFTVDVSLSFIRFSSQHT